MKKLLLMSMMLCMSVITLAQVKVQGVPRSDIKQAPAMVMANAEGTFTMDDIVNWSGEGSNRSAVVIQWNVDGETNAMAFGYRWDGNKTGADMMAAVVANNPRLYSFVQSGTPYGSTFGGCGWDVDGNGEIGLISPQGDTIWCDNEMGYFVASGYSYDGYTSADPTDWWRSGWMSGYWSYWMKASAEETFKYASTGMSGRKLTDGSWDGWNYGGASWKPIVSAPSLIPDDAPRSFTINGVCYSLLTWSEKHKTVAVVAPFEGSGITYEGVIDVPATFVSNEITYEVVAVADSAFAGTSALTSVSLPSSVTKIGNDAFLNSGVSTVTIPEQIKSIGAEAFMGCANLTQITIPASMTAIPEGAFAGTGITSLVLPATVTTVGAHAFEGCAALATLEFAQQVTAIGENAFSGCPLTSVKSISIVPAVCGAQAFDSTTTATATLTVPLGFIDTYKAADVWKDFQNFAEQTIPVNLGDRFAKGGVMYQVTALSDDANEVKVTYYNNQSNINTSNAQGYGAEVSVPATINYQGIDFTVTEIGDSAMMGATSITTLNIAEGVKRIGLRGLYNCNKLENLTLPASLQSLGGYAFYNNAFTSLTIPDGVTELPTNLFYNCKKMETVNIPATVTKIADCLFYSCSALKSNPLPATVTEWPLQTFAYCSSLTEVVVPENVTLGQSVFANCTSLTTLTLPQSVTAIPYRLCYSCAALENLTMSQQVTEVDDYAFDGCKKLNLNLPQTITTIGNYAFENCALTEVNLPNLATLGKNGLASNPNLAVINIPNATEIGQYAFSACTSLTEFALPAGVTKLNSGTFTKCSALTKVTGLAGITDVPMHCFSSCSALTDLDFGTEIKSIGSYAFDGCSSLANFELGDALTTIGQYGFRNCTAMSDFVLPPTMGRITTSDVFFGDTEAHLWSTLENPAAMGNYTFRTVSATPMQFLPVTVLTGTKDKYAELAGWKNCEITEPEVKGLATSDAQAEVTTTTAEISVEAGVAYVDSLPEAFAKYNDAHVLEALPEVMFEYQVAELPQEVSMLNDDEAQLKTVPATLTDSVYTAVLDELTANTTYQYRLVMADAEGNKIYSDWHEFTTESGVTGIAQLLNAKPVAGVSYYNAQGQQSSQAFDGVNIVVIRYADGTRKIVKMIN